MAQTGEQKAHLRAIVQTRCAARTPRDPQHVEAATNLDVINIGAHEHCMIARPSATRHGVTDLCSNPIGLVRGRPESTERHGYRVARHPLWGELL